MITVIIRSVGERTEGLCKEIISDQLGNNEVFMISEIPFSNTLRKSFELGININRKWTLCIDSDVLLRKNSISKMMEFAEEVDNNVCEVQFNVFDKFFNSSRPAGNHLYRTNLLPLVLEKIPKEGVSLRPESYMLNQMKEAGYDNYNIDYTIGIHDFEQYYADIFRKAYVQSYKHDFLIPMFLNDWRDKSEIDLDFKAALWGLAAGIALKQEVFINKNCAPYDFFYHLANGNFQEKELLKSTIEIKTNIEELSSIAHVNETLKKHLVFQNNVNKVNEISKYSIKDVISVIKDYFYR